MSEGRDIVHHLAPMVRGHLAMTASCIYPNYAMRLITRHPTHVVVVVLLGVVYAGKKRLVPLIFIMQVVL